MGLSRTDLESNLLQRTVLQSGLNLPVLSEAQLQASIDETLKPHKQNSDIYLFAYGSLIWNPLFEYVDRRVGTIYGWHRRFCLWTPVGRGTPDNPGLVLGLDRGGSCRGLLYRIAAANAPSELPLIWRREMVVGSYIPRWVKVFEGDRCFEAIAFVINRHTSGYAGKLSPEVTAKRIAKAGGELGSCAEYLAQTLEGLNHFGIVDRQLLGLHHRVRAMANSPTQTLVGVG